MAKYQFMTGKPNNTINADIGLIQIHADAEGIVEMSDDHPAFARMQAAFPNFEEIPKEVVYIEVPVAVPVAEPAKKPATKKK